MEINKYIKIIDLFSKIEEMGAAMQRGDTTNATPIIVTKPSGNGRRAEGKKEKKTAKFIVKYEKIG